MNKTHVQYGCGLSAPLEWENFDVSPTLRIQNTPLLGRLLKNQLNTQFPPNVKYGDIIKGLPIEANSCEGVYCSHTLEHLSLEDFRLALENTYTILKKGGIFRCVVPDLEFAARTYIADLEGGNPNASMIFFDNTLLGITKKPRGIKAILSAILGTVHHLWMWDKKSLTEELKNAGFINIRTCSFNDSQDKFFTLVEDETRFKDALAIECYK